jgi:hypothetical protein
MCPTRVDAVEKRFCGLERTTTHNIDSEQAPPFELFVQSFNRIRRPGAAPLARRQLGEGEELFVSFLEAIGNRPALKPPLADEGLAPGFDLLGRGRIDHVGVIGGDLVMQALGRVGEQIAMLMDLMPTSA